MGLRKPSSRSTALDTRREPSADALWLLNTLGVGHYDKIPEDILDRMRQPDRELWERVLAEVVHGGFSYDYLHELAGRPRIRRADPEAGYPEHATLAVCTKLDRRTGALREAALTVSEIAHRLKADVHNVAREIRSPVLSCFCYLDPGAKDQWERPIYVYGKPVAYQKPRQDGRGGAYNIAIRWGNVPAPLRESVKATYETLEKAREKAKTESEEARKRFQSVAGRSRQFIQAVNADAGAAMQEEWVDATVEQLAMAAAAGGGVEFDSDADSGLGVKTDPGFGVELVPVLGVEIDRAYKGRHNRDITVTEEKSSSSSVPLSEPPPATTDDDESDPENPRAYQLLEAIRNHAPEADLESANRLYHECRRRHAAATAQEVAEAVHIKCGSQLHPGVKNRVGWILTAVPKMFEHRSAPRPTPEVRAAHCRECSGTGIVGGVANGDGLSLSGARQTLLAGARLCSCAETADWRKLISDYLAEQEMSPCPTKNCSTK